MKNYYAILFIAVLTTTINAQIKAVTETGDEVNLYTNGTWKYVNENTYKSEDIKLNPKKFSTPKNSTFVLKSEKIDIGFHLDPTLWSFGKATENPEAEYELQLKGEDLYSMIITEKVEIPLENLKSIALENGREAAPDLSVVQEEYRIVNNQKVLFLELAGTLQGIKFNYYGYYFSFEGGTLQFITYTSQSLMDSYRADADNLLNGMFFLNE